MNLLKTMIDLLEGQSKRRPGYVLIGVLESDKISAAFATGHIGPKFPFQRVSRPSLNMQVPDSSCNRGGVTCSLNYLQKSQSSYEGASISNHVSRWIYRATAVYLKLLQHSQAYVILDLRAWKSNGEGVRRKLQKKFQYN